MKWSKVGGWPQNNAGAAAALVGSLSAGNVPGTVAAGVSIEGLRSAYGLG